jgi:hypothetical protein
MDNRTKDLINRLLELASIDEVNEEILSTHEEISGSLKDKGYVIEDEGFQDFVADQSISNRQDFTDFKYYNEINFIKNGIEHGWSTYVDDQENYEDIQDQIEDLIQNLG